MPVQLRNHCSWPRELADQCCLYVGASISAYLGYTVSGRDICVGKAMDLSSSEGSLSLNPKRINLKEKRKR